MSVAFRRLLLHPDFFLIARRLTVRSKRSEDSLAEVEMYRSTATRWIATPLLAVAIIAQSFAGVESVSCQCSGSEVGEGGSSCGCHCPQGSRDEVPGCCSKAVTRSASPGPSATGMCATAETHATSASCCLAKAPARACRCGCSHLPSDPVPPMNTGQIDTNRVQLLLGWFDVSLVRTSIPRVGSEIRHDSLGSSASGPSVQVLCCTWLT